MACRMLPLLLALLVQATWAAGGAAGHTLSAAQDAGQWKEVPDVDVDWVRPSAEAAIEAFNGMAAGLQGCFRRLRLLRVEDMQVHAQSAPRLYRLTAAVNVTFSGNCSVVFGTVVNRLSNALYESETRATTRILYPSNADEIVEALQAVDTRKPTTDEMEWMARAVVVRFNDLPGSACREALILARSSLVDVFRPNFYLELEVSARTNKACAVEMDLGAYTLLGIRVVADGAALDVRRPSLAAPPRLAHSQRVERGGWFARDPRSPDVAMAVKAVLPEIKAMHRANCTGELFFVGVESAHGNAVEPRLMRFLMFFDGNHCVTTGGGPIRVECRVAREGMSNVFKLAEPQTLDALQQSASVHVTLPVYEPVHYMPLVEADLAAFFAMRAIDDLSKRLVYISLGLQGVLSAYVQEGTLHMDMRVRATAAGVSTVIHYDYGMWDLLGVRVGVQGGAWALLAPESNEDILLVQHDQSCDIGPEGSDSADGSPSRRKKDSNLCVWRLRMDRRPQLDLYKDRVLYEDKGAQHACHQHEDCVGGTMCHHGSCFVGLAEGYPCSSVGKPGSPPAPCREGLVCDYFNAIDIMAKDAPAHNLGVCVRPRH